MSTFQELMTEFSNSLPTDGGILTRESVISAIGTFVLLYSASPHYLMA